MKILPTAAADRRRLILLFGGLAIAVFLWVRNSGAPEYVIPQTTGPAPTSNPVAGSKTPTRTAAGQNPLVKGDTSIPQALKLAELDQVPEEPQAGRNLFRFGVRPLPPPKPLPPQPPPPVPQPPAPPPPPQVELRLNTIIPDDAAGKRRAYLRDPKTNATFEGLEGQIIDGKYKLIAVGERDVVVSFLDGSGRRTIQIGG